jgi:hypothetical protein
MIFLFPDPSGLQYQTAVVFADWDDIARSTRTLLQNEKLRKSMQIAGFNFASVLMGNTTALQSALASSIQQ